MILVTGAAGFIGFHVTLKLLEQGYEVTGLDNLNSYYDVKLKKIPVGGGFHDWHCENSSITSATRTIVIQLYLNTIQEAGETEFLYLNKRVNAVQGRVIIFPAAYTHTHRGNPPIGQTKYIGTTWGILQAK